MVETIVGNDSFGGQKIGKQKIEESRASTSENPSEMKNSQFFFPPLKGRRNAQDR